MICHEDPDLKTEEGKLLFIEYVKFLSSVHGESGVSCVGCHSDLRGFEDFPHAEKLETVSCGECHDKPAEEFKASIQGEHPQRGNYQKRFLDS